MATTESEVARARRLGYAVGYTAGMRGKWPGHRIGLLPDDPRITAVLRAAQALRDEADSQLAMMAPGDLPELSEKVDAFDAAVREFNAKLFAEAGAS